MLDTLRRVLVLLDLFARLFLVVSTVLVANLLNPLFCRLAGFHLGNDVKSGLGWWRYCFG